MKAATRSGVIGPFCYTGKRRFEKALSPFDHMQDIGITGKSFRLNPGGKTEPGKTIHQLPAATKDWPPEQARKAHACTTGMAPPDKGDAMEEQIFKACFTDGRNTAGKDQ